MKILNCKIVNSQSGFTLMELLLVIAISAVVTVGSFTYLGGYRTEQNLKLTASEVLSAVKNAQQLSKSQQDGKKWGVRFFNTTSSGYYSVFSGTSFDSGTVSKTYYLGRNINFGNPGSSSTIDVLFNASTGNPSQSQVISLNSGRGEGFIGDIAVSTLGIISSKFDTGLVGYWHMDENTSSTTYDASGNNNNGMLTNSPTWNTGTNCKVGSCLNFDGLSNYINVTDSSFLDITGSHTIVAWIKTDVLDNSWRAVLGKFDGGSNANYNFGKFGNSGGNVDKLFYSYNNGGWKDFISSFTFTAGVWYHIGIVVNAGGGVDFYVNGILNSSVLTDQLGASLPGTFPNNNADLKIGYNNVGSQYWDGSIDEVRIYNRALSATEIADVYNTAR